MFSFFFLNFIYTNSQYLIQNGVLFSINFFKIEKSDMKPMKFWQLITYKKIFNIWKTTEYILLGGQWCVFLTAEYGNKYDKEESSHTVVLDGLCHLQCSKESRENKGLLQVTTAAVNPFRIIYIASIWLATMEVFCSKICY